MKEIRLLRSIGSICLALIITCVWAFAPGPAAGQAKAEYKWRFASAWTEKERNESLALFCDLVGVYSNGKIQMKFQPSGLLGNHDEIFHAVRRGEIEMGVFAPYVTLVPGGMLNWMPWTIGNYDEAAIAYAAPNGIIYRTMDDAWEEVGFKLLFSNPNGAYGIGNRTRPLKTPEDFKNLKLRVSASLGFVRALENMGKGSGMTLQTIPWADLYNALERGVVDGCWSTWTSLVELRHHEVLKYYTDLGFSWECSNVAMNRKLWDKLPKDLKDTITRAARIAEERDFEAHRRSDREYEKKLVATGLKIYYPTPEERELFRKKANMPAVWQELCKPWLDKRYPGQNMTQKIQDELERIRAEVRQ